MEVLCDLDCLGCSILGTDIETTPILCHNQKFWLDLSSENCFYCLHIFGIHFEFIPTDQDPLEISLFNCFLVEVAFSICS